MLKIRRDVEERRQRVQAEFGTYFAAHKDEIRATMERVAQLGSEAAATPEARLANARHASVSEGVFLEQTVGQDDKAPIHFLERGMRAARAVCRIVDFAGTALGTGFLVGPGLLITNNHVLPDASSADGAMAEFGYELDADENPVPRRRFALEPARLFVTSPRDALDFSFVTVALIGEAGEDLAAQGWLPTDQRPHKILDGQPVVIIQHPDGQPKAICLFDSRCVFRDEEPDHPYLLCTTDTEFGSSGSPAFNRFWQVIALHHAGIDTGEREHGRPVVMNRGIRVSSIYRALEAGVGDGRVLGAPSHAQAILEVLMDPATRRTD